MSKDGHGRYEVKVVFRGLFLACIHEPTGAIKAGSIEVLLPNARSGQGSSQALQELLTAMQPLREHQAVVEFPIADWDNRSALMPGLIQVDKPTKEPVGVFFLREHSIRFRGLWGGAAAMAMPEAPIEQGDYQVLAQEPTTKQVRLALLAQHTEHGFDQLPGFHGTPEAGSPEEKRCAARTEFTHGEVYTERRSRKGGVDRQWEELLPADLKNPETPANARAINLDLVVRFTLPVTDPLLVVCEPLAPGGPEPRQFILKPSNAARGLTVWVKNRELDAILFDSDLLPDPYDLDCSDSDNVDRDHAHYMRLAATPGDLKVPRCLGNEASDCGSGCGGCGHPPKP
jgi:hypothetical protein